MAKFDRPMQASPKSESEKEFSGQIEQQITTTDFQPEVQVRQEFGVSNAVLSNEKMNIDAKIRRKIVQNIQIFVQVIRTEWICTFGENQPHLGHALEIWPAPFFCPW